LSELINFLLQLLEFLCILLQTTVWYYVRNSAMKVCLCALGVGELGDVSDDSIRALSQMACSVRYNNPNTNPLYSYSILDKNLSLNNNKYLSEQLLHIIAGKQLA